MGDFCRKICYQEVQKIAQSGHTEFKISLKKLKLGIPYQNRLSGRVYLKPVLASSALQLRLINMFMPQCLKWKNKLQKNLATENCRNVDGFLDSKMQPVRLLCTLCWTAFCQVSTSVTRKIDLKVAEKFAQLLPRQFSLENEGF